MKYEVVRGQDVLILDIECHFLYRKDEFVHRLLCITRYVGIVSDQ